MKFNSALVCTLACLFSIYNFAASRTADIMKFPPEIEACFDTMSNVDKPTLKLLEIVSTEPLLLPLIQLRKFSQLPDKDRVLVLASEGGEAGHYFVRLLFHYLNQRSHFHLDPYPYANIAYTYVQQNPNLDFWEGFVLDHGNILAAGLRVLEREMATKAGQSDLADSVDQEDLLQELYHSHRELRPFATNSSGNGGSEDLSRIQTAISQISDAGHTRIEKIRDGFYRELGAKLFQFIEQGHRNRNPVFMLRLYAADLGGGTAKKLPDRILQFLKTAAAMVRERPKDGPITVISLPEVTEELLADIEAQADLKDIVSLIRLDPNSKSAVF